MNEMNVLQKFLSEIKKVVPSKMMSLYKLIDEYVTHPETQSLDARNSGRHGFKYVFNLASAAMERTYGWRSIPRWKRQLFVPAILTWYFSRRAAYLEQRDRLIVVKDAWKAHEILVKQMEEEDASKDNTDTRELEVPAGQPTS